MPLTPPARRSRLTGGTSVLWIALAWLGGCTPVVYTPPSRFLPLESSAVLAPDELGVQLEGGVDGRTFGPTLVHGTLRVRGLVYARLEAAGEATVAHVGGDAAVEQHRQIYLGRGGVKYELERCCSVSAGVGAGASTAGGFVGPDLGLKLAFENPYLVPFLDLRAGFSAPFAERAIDVSTADDGAGTDVLAPELSGHAAAIAGLKLVFGPERAPVAHLSAGLQLVELFDERRHDAFVGLGGALEWIVR